MCDAFVWCGPGHQSKAVCERDDDHAGDTDDPHLAYQPRTRVQLLWEGPEAMTGFFDESPL